MFTGTTIEQLIQSVERAEHQARQPQQQASFAAPQAPVFQSRWQGMVEVA
jgi:hypothetical protein